MAETNEPRALSAALSGPAMTTRMGGLAMHAADRHVERWAPETTASKSRPLRNLGFVDRTIAPWIETAQRSASLRLFSQVRAEGLGERQPGHVSWVFPRPWYQDELDWMTAARQAPMQMGAQAPAPLLTTRGTYVQPAQAQQSPAALPAALYEFIAPSLSVAQPTTEAQGIGYGGNNDAYSPLVSLAAVQAASVMQRAIAPTLQTPNARVQPALRNVLSSMLERAAVQREEVPSRISMQAPELVTPPAPRADDGGRRAALAQTHEQTEAMQLAERYAEQRAQIAEVQRVARVAAEREMAARVEAARAQLAAQTTASSTQAAPNVREASARAEAELRQRAAAATPSTDAARSEAARIEAARSEAARIEAARARATASDAEAQTSSAGEAAATTEAARVEAARVEAARVEAARVEAARQAERVARGEATRGDAAQALKAEQAREAERIERARIEERIAQRLAERSSPAPSTGRLHEQSRLEAAAHARAEAERAVTAATAVAATTTSPAARAPQQTAPAEVAAAIASLPPELQAFISQRPDGAMRAIDELNDALRSVELLSRAAASGTAFESTRGPRLMMPAGLGGLVAAIDRAHAIGDQPGGLAGQRAPMPAALRADAGAAPMGAMPGAAGMSPAALRAAASARVPTMSFLSASSARPIGADPRMLAGTTAHAPTSALEAATTASPAALTHVAWADRWLARFAGASQQSLDTLTAAGGFDRATRMQALASAAPSSVFVSPTFDIERTAPASMTAAMRAAAIGAPPSLAAAPPAMPTLSIVPPVASSMPATAPTAQTTTAAAPSDVPGPRLIERLPEAVRYDDDAETPDEVFAAIAAGVTRARQAAPAAPAQSATTTYGAPLTSVPATPLSPMQTADRYTAADAVAHAAPNAPGAGFAAQLASSPFAPALRHVLPLSTAPSFDVRALFGGGLSATYLAGLLASSADEVYTPMLPSWAAWTQQPAIGAEGFEPASLSREAPAWDATYVAPDALDLPSVADAGEPSVGESSRAAESRAAELRAGLPADESAVAASQPMLEARAQLEAATTQLTTLRSTLLSWNVEATPTGTAFVPSHDVAAPSVVSRTSTSPITTATARTMIEAMSLPMLGDPSTAEPSPEGAAWTAPGMVADRAHAWSVAQERSSADLSFDFVPPELVLAARVYGLGPAEAAQAARLALAGPGHLTAMAGTVDRTFVQAMSMEAERRERAQLTTAYPTSRGEIAAATRAAATPLSSAAASATASSSSTPAAATLASASDASGSATPESIAASMSTFTHGSGGTSFGVDRKAPRGAFLWPSATVAALGLTAGAGDGQQTMSIAALELLAAQAVAELGTFTALSDNGRDVIDASSTEVARASTRDEVAPTAASQVAAGASIARGDAAARVQQSGAAEPAEADVLASASALIPASRRARFDALYVALSQSSSSASWSPAARAARALALAGRGEDGPVSARERATFAWDVLPVVYADAIASFGADKAAAAFSEAPSSSSTSSVYASDGTTPSERRSRGQQADRRTMAGREYVSVDDIQVDGRPGLAGLSARAGEALGSYVTPYGGTAAPSTSSSSSSSSSSSPREREVGAMLRVPSAAQELVRTGQPSGRHGGGETEIPAWFEKAARKMLEDRSAPSDGISMAELTLVTAAPSAHIAASTRTAPAANPVTAGANNQAQSAQAGAADIDVEKIANDIYRHILVMMDVARARNGEPYL